MNKIKKTTTDGVTAVLIAILFFVLPFERIPTVELGGYTIKISYLVGLILIAFLLGGGKFFQLFRNHPLSSADKALAGLWLVGLFSVFFSADTKKSLIVLLMWAFVFLLHIILNRLMLDAKVRYRAETWLIVVTSLVCVFGIYQFWGDSLGLPMEATGLRFLYTKAIFGFPRIQSVGLEPLYFGNFLLVPLFLTLRRYLKDKKIFNVYWFIALIIAINLILGIARSVYISIIVTILSLIIFLVVQKEDRQVLVKKALGIMMVAAISIGLSLSFIRLANGPKATTTFVGHAAVNDTKVSTSIPGRLETYKFAFKKYLEKPIMGIGIGGFGAAIANAPGEAIQYGETMVVNNEYLEILTELGTIGFIAFWIFIILVLKEITSVYKGAEASARRDLFLLFLGLTAIFIQYNFFSTLYIIYVWVFLAMLRAEAKALEPKIKE